MLMDTFQVGFHLSWNYGYWFRWIIDPCLLRKITVVYHGWDALESAGGRNNIVYALYFLLSGNQFKWNFISALFLWDVLVDWFFRDSIQFVDIVSGFI